jgi:RNA polymerase sigma-70 factor (ECF subfamily)
VLVVSEHEQLPVQGAKSGNPEAWHVLFKRYQLPLYVYARELVHDEQASLDIVQESFINAARHLGGLQDNARFGSWLFSIAHQKCIQHWRKRRPDPVPIESEEADYESGEADPREFLIRKEQEAAFMKLLEQLPVPHRAVLLLHCVEDFSVEEIARITDAPPGTVKSRLHYARQSLKKLIGEYPS